jgi:hypothetical protein
MKERKVRKQALLWGSLPRFGIAIWKRWKRPVEVLQSRFDRWIVQISGDEYVGRPVQQAEGWTSSRSSGRLGSDYLKPLVPALP